ncbi:MAG: YDG domain-containing protein [Fibromonadaceae bacterium]|jgi:hypothetical protein|nr:YDG domain-containing protein [Fibromonadaceae bacterium]
MKKALLILAVALVPLFAQNTSWYTSNPNAATFEISTEEELRGLASLVNEGTTNFSNKTIKLANNIALSSTWTPIGNNISTGSQFHGVFDGQGYTISGLSVDVARYAGLFGLVESGGQIKNVNIIASKIKARNVSNPDRGQNRVYAGGIAGYYRSDLPIENCSVQADSIVAISGNNAVDIINVSLNFAYAGGLTGYQESSSLGGHTLISNSHTSANILALAFEDRSWADGSALSYSGGLVGHARNIVIENSYSSRNVLATGYADDINSYSGGLIGRTSESSNIINSYATGDVSATYDNSWAIRARFFTLESASGGLVGYTDSVNIANSRATGNVLADGFFIAYSGGLVGRASWGNIIYSFATRTVTASSRWEAYSGGLAGYTRGNFNILYSYANGNVSTNLGTNYFGDVAGGYSGGLLGYAEEGRANEQFTISIENSYASGNVSTSMANSFSGGLIGGINFFNGVINATNSYASGNMSPSGTKSCYRGIGPSGTYTSVYYRYSPSMPYSCNDWSGNGENLSNSAMMRKASFIGWNFDNIWDITENSSYPFLRIPTHMLACVAADIPTQPYSSALITPEISVACNGAPLTQNLDYMVSYEMNKNAGTGVATITGMGNYTGSITKKFAITPKSLSIINATVQNKTYDGTTAAIITGTLSNVIEGDEVSFNGTGAFASKDAGGNIEVTPTITLNGAQAGNYILEQPTDLKANITPKELAENAIKYVFHQFYSGSPLTPGMDVMDGSVLLIRDRDYEIINLENNTNAGNNTASVTIAGIGNYTGTATANFIINPYPIFSSTIQTIPAQIYTGSDITPEIVVMVGSKVLESGTDYEISSFANNKNKGTASVTVTGKGNYQSTATANFTINPKPLIVTEATAQNKIYDGTTAAIITGATLQGVCENDIGKISLTNSTSGIFATTNAGTNISINTNMTLSGAAAANYTLTQPTLTGTITPKTLPPNAIQPISSQVYNGSARTPSITVRDGSTLLTAIDYEITDWTNNINAGTNTASVTITGKGNYQGTATANFTINPTHISWVTFQISSETYTGFDIIPPINAKDGSLILENDIDYKISGITNNKNKGTATVTITGIGNYYSTRTVYFTINPKPLTVTEAIAENKTYDGTTIAIITNATLSGIVNSDVVNLANHTIGTFTSANVGENISVTTNIYLTGTDVDNYSLTQPTGLKANITPKTLPSNAIQPIFSQVYNGSARTPSITVRDGITSLTAIDYEITDWANNINAGTNTASVSITGKGNYEGTAIAYFTITPKFLSNNMIEAIPNQPYAGGNAIEPIITVKDGTITLVEDTHYIVEYSNNMTGGTATATITGIGNYTGIASANFEILNNNTIISNHENPLIKRIEVQTIYYNLHGTALGTQKPTTPGVYIEYHKGVAKRIMVW